MSQQSTCTGDRTAHTRHIFLNPTRASKFWTHTRALAFRVFAACSLTHVQIVSQSCGFIGCVSVGLVVGTLRTCRIRHICLHSRAHTQSYQVSKARNSVLPNNDACASCSKTISEILWVPQVLIAASLRHGPVCVVPRIFSSASSLDSHRNHVQPQIAFH